MKHLIVILVSLATLVYCSAECKSSFDCALNGDCVGGVCACDAAWTGSDDCRQLALLPTNRTVVGYRNQTGPQGWASWGGRPIVGPDGRYHLYAAQMQLHCGLKHWGTNSEIIHAISSSPYGPYQYHDTAVSRFSHNPTVHAHNGTYHIFHIGNGDNSTTPVDCTTEATSHTRETRSAAPVNSGLMVSSSSSLYGPWSQIELQLYNTEGSKLLNCSWSNPAPFIHANGTTLLAFTAGYCHGHTEVLGIARADSWRGPYTLLSLEPLSKRPWDCLSNQQFEDPFLWYDHRGYHILSHGMCPTGVLNAKLLYSRDGVTWSLSKREPYHYTVHWSQGDSQTYIRLERPQLLFANDGSMRPVALFNGVEALGELSYTLARPIAQ